MPGNGLALAIGIACQIDFAGILGIFFQSLDEVALAPDIDVLGLEVVLHIDAKLALGQIPEMSHGGTHHVLLAQIFLYGLGLSRGLHHHQGLLHFAGRSFLLWPYLFLFFCFRNCCSQTVTPSPHACRHAVRFLPQCLPSPSAGAGRTRWKPPLPAGILLFHP